MRYGQLGYFIAIFYELARLNRRPFPLMVEGQAEPDRRPCLFLTFNNSKFTGGTMMIAPQARTDDGLIEYVRWGPISRMGLIRNLNTLYDGTHVQHPLAERQAVRRIDFELDAPGRRDGRWRSADVALSDTGCLAVRTRRRGIREPE